MRRLLIASSLFLLLPFLARAEAPYLSEIAWAGSSVSTADEWFEICGAPGASLAGWSIEGASAAPIVLPTDAVFSADGSYLIANYSADDPKSSLAAAPDLVTTSVALSNSVSYLILRDAAGGIIDVAGASGTAPFAGTSGSAKASMERLLPLADGGGAAAWTTASAASGFDEGATELGTPGACPSASAAVPEPVATTTVETVTPPRSNIEPVAGVRLSELYPAPLAGEKEWVELVNISDIGVFLDGWALEDGKGTPTPLEGLLPPFARVTVVAPKGSLNNDGDLALLRDPFGRVVDRAAYGAWPDDVAPHVGAVKKGESVIRLEWQDVFEITDRPTPGAPNLRKAPDAEPPEEIAPAPLPPAPPAAAAVIAAPRPVAVAATATPVVPLKDVAPPPARAKVPSPAPKAPAAKYKGAAYAGIVAAPPGVYAKTRVYVLRGDALDEVRLSKSTAVAYAPGQRVTFVAQAKDDGAGRYLLANPNSFRAATLSASATFATIDAWPERGGAYRFEAEVVARDGTSLEVRLGGRSGNVVTPTALAALKPGDVVAIEAYVAPGERPRAILSRADAVTVVKAFAPPDAARTPAREKLPWQAAVGLTLATACVGMIAYLRHQRLQRIALVMRPFDEEA